MKTILMLGTFDSKGHEFDYLYAELKRRGVDILTMNVGVYAPTSSFDIDIDASLVAHEGGVELEELRRVGDRGQAMKTMCIGARTLAVRLQEAHKIDGVISMGGGGGTSIASTAMQALPIGFPKLCITTLASGDTREYVGTKDVVLFPSIVDISGINQFSRMIISRAAGAICGMAALDPLPDENDRPIVCLSMFGNSTQCIEQCADLLHRDRYETMVFHATGGGGRSLEEFIRGGHCAAVLDLTTTEWADELAGGILSAGPARLDAISAVDIPAVLAPGCMDMVNFGTMETVPETYKAAGRRFYSWNPMVTLMRTNEEESRALGKVLAEKANAAKGPVAVIFPRRGLSILDGVGQPFWDPAADAALAEAIQENLRADIPYVEVDANINDPEFSEAAVALLYRLWKK